DYRGRIAADEPIGGELWRPLLFRGRCGRSPRCGAASRVRTQGAVITLVLSLADALGYRFAVSPLGEAVVLSRAMALPGVFARGTPAAWLRRHELARRRLEREHDLRPLLVLLRSDTH